MGMKKKESPALSFVEREVNGWIAVFKKSLGEYGVEDGESLKELAKWLTGYHVFAIEQLLFKEVFVHSFSDPEVERFRFYQLRRFELACKGILEKELEKF